MPWPDYAKASDRLTQRESESENPKKENPLWNKGRSLGLRNGGSGSRIEAVFEMFMRRRRRAFANWPLACFIMVCGAGEAPSQPSVASNLLARYPQIGSAVLESHLNPDVNLKKWKFILDIMQFSGGTGTSSQECRVSADGRVSESWFDQSGGKEGYRYSLSSNEFQRLTETIELLPDGKDLPSLNRLLIVSYSRGTNWVTSTYDIARIPRRLKSLFHICGCGLGYDPNRYRWLSDSPATGSSEAGTK